MSAKPIILVVDDQAANVKLLEQLLSLSGFEVVTASSGKEALDRLDAANPDIVLLDVVMPKMSGYEVCRAIRANEATQLLPVVMVTRSIRRRSGSRESRRAPTISSRSRSTSRSCSRGCDRCFAFAPSIGRWRTRPRSSPNGTSGSSSA